MFFCLRTACWHIQVAWMLNILFWNVAIIIYLHLYLLHNYTARDLHYSIHGVHLVTMSVQTLSRELCRHMGDNIFHLRMVSIYNWTIDRPLHQHMSTIVRWRTPDSYSMLAVVFHLWINQMSIDYEYAWW